MRKRFFSGWVGTSLASFTLLFFLLGTFSAITLLNARTAQAGEEPPAEELPDDDELDEPAPDEDEKPSEESAETETNLLIWMFHALGWGFSLIFLSLSFTMVALTVMNLLTARRESVLPVALIEGFDAQLNEKRYQEAYELAKNDDSFLGQVLSAGLAKLSKGYEQAIEAMQEEGEEENMKMEHRLSYLALIGTISPMVGLFGTVWGMIAAFRVIATSGGVPNPAELAAGISTALFTTLLGLAIAIPAIAIYNILKNRIDRLVLEVGIVSEELMSRFSAVGNKK